MKSINRALFVTLAYICIIIGVVGIFLPLIPTTPFLLLATILLTKSSPKLAQKLLDNRYLGIYIRSYLHGDRLPLRDKIRMILLVVGIMTLSIVYATDNLYMRIGLTVIALSVTIHILLLKPRKAK